MNAFKKAAVFFLPLLILFSCPPFRLGIPYSDLSEIPEDTGGFHIPYVLGSTSSPYGFFVYIPGGYDQTDQKYPLIVFLHGAGECGNSQDDPDNLNQVLANGPPRLINHDSWDPAVPFIVVSPQCHDSGWNTQKIHEFTAYIINQYRIRTDRIYVTGLSMGGYGTFSYIGSYGDDSCAAAAVPICGGGNTAQAEQFRNIPLWAFHGLEDKTVVPENSINMVNAINAENPAVRAKLTVYPGVYHDSWSRTYDGTGMGTESEDYDPFDTDIFDWMLQYRKPL